MFLSRNKKNNVYPCKPEFYYTEVGFKGGQNFMGMFLRWLTPWFVVRLRFPCNIVLLRIFPFLDLMLIVPLYKKHHQRYYNKQQLMIFFRIFPENRLQSVSLSFPSENLLTGLEDNLQETSRPIFRQNKKTITNLSSAHADLGSITFKCNWLQLLLNFMITITIITVIHRTQFRYFTVSFSKCNHKVIKK